MARAEAVVVEVTVAANGVAAPAALLSLLLL